MKNKLDLVKMWVKKAESDLITAKHSLKIKPITPTDTICFHAQQCVEKYLKAFLVYHEIDFEKTHDLGDLLTLASKVDYSFAQLIEMCSQLTPYAVEIRYPFLMEEPTEEEAQESVKISEKIKEFVMKRIQLK